MKKKKSKHPKVTLRMKHITGQRQSLYLDIYPPIIDPVTDNLTRRKFLDLFVWNEFEYKKQPLNESFGRKQTAWVPVMEGSRDRKGNPVEKQRRIRLDEVQVTHNQEAMRTAERIRARIETELLAPEIYTQLEKKKLEEDQRREKRQKESFLDFFLKQADQRKESNRDVWLITYRHLKQFTGGRLSFADITLSFCNSFRDYLMKGPSLRTEGRELSQNSKAAYFRKFRAAIKQAHKDGKLEEDLYHQVPSIEDGKTVREYLNLEELRRLAVTDCGVPVLKRAAMFSALTGLRFSDIEKLTWKEIQYSEAEGHHLTFRQKKTDQPEILPIPDNALQWTGPAGEPEAKVFDGLEYSAYNNDLLRKWTTAAGITRHITFHSFRHTFATLQLTLGTDIYTVSKMLGHQSVKTTEIYTKVIDQKKREAADRMRFDL